MSLMSTLVFYCGNSIYFNGFRKRTHTHFSCNVSSAQVRIIGYKRKRGLGLIPNAKSGGSRKKAWWQRLFEEGGESWFSMNEDDLIEEIQSMEQQQQKEEDGLALEDKKFEAWRRRAEAVSELRNAQEDAKNADNREWEEWLGHDSSFSNADGSSWEQDLDEKVARMDNVSDDESDDLKEMFPEQRLIRSIQGLIFRNYDDELLFEDKVFKYASTNSAKFLALLILIPWLLDFLVHDFVLLPFLDRYVKTTPLAAEFLDVRKHQKLEMVKALKIEKARLRFEVEIGKAPPLSDDEVWLELRHKAIELRDEWRLENRKAFANIWSDMVYGVSLFLLIYFNQNRVALLKFTGQKLLNNASDTGKAFLIILITDIFLGYHSESGWEALVEAILEHYGLEVDQAAITIFVCLIPVLIDACVKLWLFKFLPRLSPNVTNIFREMKRH